MQIKELCKQSKAFDDYVMNIKAFENGLINKNQTLIAAEFVAC